MLKINATVRISTLLEPCKSAHSSLLWLPTCRRIVNLPLLKTKIRALYHLKLYYRCFPFYATNFFGYTLHPCSAINNNILHIVVKDDLLVDGKTKFTCWKGLSKNKRIKKLTNYLLLIYIRSLDVEVWICRIHVISQQLKVDWFIFDWSKEKR